jgi:glycosyltransferase involved in cell wall biosynthesis
MGKIIKQGLSIVILTRNEESKIRNFLDCVKDFADEVVVVDDCSTDNTVKICKEYGCKVIIHPLEKNFSRQRNLGSSYAKGEWIFQTAPDEYIPAETKKMIEEALNKENNEFVAFQLKRKNFFINYPLRYSGAYHWDTRMFKKGYAHYEGTPHEKIFVKGKIGKIDADIYHFAFDNIREVISAGNFYTEIEAEEFLKGRNRVSFREIKYRLTWKSLKLFWKLYIKKKGYKDGMYGLAWCILNVIGPQIRWLKIWERALREGKLEK